VEIIRRATDAFNRRDVELLADLTTPDFAWFPALPGLSLKAVTLRSRRRGPAERPVPFAA
jgi:ketosteroid isomerase-like protein